MGGIQGEGDEGEVRFPQRGRRVEIFVSDSMYITPQIPYLTCEDPPFKQDPLIPPPP